jgi:hypothetical protein
MSWMFTRPDYWEPLSGRVIYWDPTKNVHGCLMDAGYIPVKGDARVSALGSWSLYARVRGDARLPSYYLLVDDGTGTLAEIWIPTFADLMVWMSTYGRLGEKVTM